jgi:hypothetical protein
MAQFGIDQTDVGYLNVVKSEKNERIELYFVPSQMPDADAKTRYRLSGGLKLAYYYPERRLLETYPLNTLFGREGYLGPKYRKIRKLSIRVEYGICSESDIEWIFNELPSGFVKDFRYGLGLLRDCNRIIRLIEQHTSCEELLFCDNDEVRADGGTFRFGLSRFNAIWSEIRRIGDRGTRAAARVKDAFVHNSFAGELGLPKVEYSLGRHPVSGVIAKAADGIEELSSSEYGVLVGAISSESRRIAAEVPQKFQQLRRDIELASLEELIRTYEESLGREFKESYWQEFFEGNVFALQQVFGSPMISVRAHGAVGGRGLTRSGDKVTDYIFKNSLTNNVALVEIKRPTMPLLEKSEYRRGVFAPSKELNGAIAQVLDQAYHLTKELPVLKDNSRNWDLESYAISCIVVAGRSPSNHDPDMQKSFELYRANSRTVTIVTYDEILERLKLLLNYLTSRSRSVEGRR